MIYNLYIFDKTGKLLFYTEWNRSKESGISKDEVSFSYILYKLILITQNCWNPLSSVVLYSNIVTDKNE